ncbi:MAG: hypothetical protein AB1722_08425 [Pseudomonadota bacterium]
MKSSKPSLSTCHRQRGMVLFFALVALVAMSLAAVALIRSVDTGALIAGNLAFRKSTLNSSDNGIETAITWLANQQNANANLGLDPLLSPQHTFNLTCLATRAAGTLSASDPGCPAIVAGYHSNIDPTLDLFDNATWNDDTKSVAIANDPNDLSKNSVRYLIQRVCRTANTLPSAGDCMYSGNAAPTNPQNLKNYQNYCSNQACPPLGQAPVMRITTRAVGPDGSTKSYAQAFVY